MKKKTHSHREVHFGILDCRVDDCREAGDTIMSIYDLDEVAEGEYWLQVEDRTPLTSLLYSRAMNVIIGHMGQLNFGLKISSSVMVVFQIR